MLTKLYLRIYATCAWNPRSTVKLAEDNDEGDLIAVWRVGMSNALCKNGLLLHILKANSYFHMSVFADP